MSSLESFKKMRSSIRELRGVEIDEVRHKEMWRKRFCVGMLGFLDFVFLMSLNVVLRALR